MAKDVTQNIWVKLQGALSAENQFKKLGQTIAGMVLQYGSATYIAEKL